MPNSQSPSPPVLPSIRTSEILRFKNILSNLCSSFPLHWGLQVCCLSKTVLFSDIWAPGRTGCAGSAIDQPTLMLWSTLAMHPWLPTQVTSGPLQEHSGHQVMLKWNESGLNSSFRAVLNSHIATADLPNSPSPPGHFEFSNITFSTDPSPHSCPISLTLPCTWKHITFLSEVQQPSG